MFGPTQAIVPVQTCPASYPTWAKNRLEIRADKTTDVYGDVDYLVVKHTGEPGISPGDVVLVRDAEGPNGSVTAKDVSASSRELTELVKKAGSVSGETLYGMGYRAYRFTQESECGPGQGRFYCDESMARHSYFMRAGDAYFTSSTLLQKDVLELSARSPKTIAWSNDGWFSSDSILHELRAGESGIQAVVKQ